MSRPRPTRLATAAAVDGIHTFEIADIPQQWAVTYRGRLVSIVKQHLAHRPKYLRTMFQTAAPAYNLADKMNRLFRTEDFSAAPVVALGTPTGDEEMPRRPPGGQYYVNIDKNRSQTAEVIQGGHIVYKGKDGTEQIRLNSRAYPTDNIQKTIKKTK